MKIVQSLPYKAMRDDKGKRMAAVRNIFKTILNAVMERRMAFSAFTDVTGKKGTTYVLESFSLPCSHMPLA